MYVWFGIVVTHGLVPEGRKFCVLPRLYSPFAVPSQLHPQGRILFLREISQFTTLGPRHGRTQLAAVMRQVAGANLGARPYGISRVREGTKHTAEVL